MNELGDKAKASAMWLLLKGLNPDKNIPYDQQKLARLWDWSCSVIGEDPIAALVNSSIFVYPFDYSSTTQPEGDLSIDLQPWARLMVRLRSPSILNKLEGLSLKVIQEIGSKPTILMKAI